MPKAPILDREMFVERLKSDGTLRVLDFYLVNTSLGAMVEPRPVTRLGNEFTADVDRTDASFNRVTEVDPDYLLGTGDLMTSGLQTPREW